MDGYFSPCAFLLVEWMPISQKRRNELMRTYLCRKVAFFERHGRDEEEKNQQATVQEDRKLRKRKNKNINITKCAIAAAAVAAVCSMIVTSRCFS